MSASWKDFCPKPPTWTILMSTFTGLVKTVMDSLRLPMMLFRREMVLASTPLMYVVKLTTG